MYSNVWPEARIVENLFVCEGITSTPLTNVDESWATERVPSTPRITVKSLVFDVDFALTLINSLSTCKKSPVLIPVKFATDNVVAVFVIAESIVKLTPLTNGVKLPEIFSEAREVSCPNEFKLYL